MKAIALGSIFVLFAIVGGLTVPTAFAAVVSVPEGTAVPGCEDTDECWDPSVVTVGVGETVTWSNDDTAAHTVTSGSAADGPDGVFDSSLFMAGAEFSHTFDEVGTFEYFCMVHPWMAGQVIVTEAMMMRGEYLGLDIDPMLPFDNTVSDMVTLSFTAQSDELMGSALVSLLPTSSPPVTVKDPSEGVICSSRLPSCSWNCSLQTSLPSFVIMTL